jgi:hypothetical protein
VELGGRAIQPLRYVIHWPGVGGNSTKSKKVNVQILLYDDGKKGPKHAVIFTCRSVVIHTQYDA